MKVSTGFSYSLHVITALNGVFAYVCNGFRIECGMTDGIECGKNGTCCECVTPRVVRG